MKRFVLSTIIAWLLFIGVDFFFHASLLGTFWEEDIAALKPQGELFKLIPFGYAAFLLQTLLVGYVFKRFFHIKPARHELLRFALIMAVLLSVSNLLALYSYIDLPLTQLILFNLVLFLEVLVVSLVYNSLLFTLQPRKAAGYAVLIFILLIVSGILIQNFS